MLFLSRQKFLKLILVGSTLLLALIITGCSGLEDELPENFGIPPTVASEFAVPTAAATPTKLPTLTPITNPTATPELPLKTIVIFDDGFQNGWELVGEDLFTEVTEEIIYDGAASLKVSPRLGFSRLYIVAGEQNRRPIRREDIITVSFYLNGGSTPIGFEDMTITAQGSNANTFWTRGDRSAITTSDSFFSETQLAFLGISEIPENTWARVEFQPLEQQFDPVYNNFTGFYLANSSTLLTPYYIDRIEILMVDV